MKNVSAKTFVDDNISNILSKLSSDELRTFVNLYKNYALIDSKYEFSKNALLNDNIIDGKLLLTNNPNLKQELKLLENKIYTVNNRCIPNNERVLLELGNILKVLKKQNYSTDVLYNLKNEELHQLQILIENDKLNNEEILEFCKKKIVIMQATLGMKITFFYEGIIVFFEMLNNKLNKKENNLNNITYRARKN